jgi:hypothetical protein
MMSVSYSQIAVFDGRLENPFNCWTKSHVGQGFSWRDGSVSFKTLVDAGPVAVETEVLAEAKIVPGCVRAISVPFVVDGQAKVEVATITESYPVTINPGRYQLVYQTGWRDSVNWVRLVFVPGGLQESAILVRDDEIDATRPFVMAANPA